MSTSIKIHCVAFAAFAAVMAAPAVAQSNVNISGTIDIGLVKDFSGNKDIGQISRSYLTFAGSEDLGGGMKANFKLRHRFMPDTGLPSDTIGSGKPFWHGEASVGLSGGFGSFKMGRALDVIGNNSWAYDPWYNFDSIASPAWQTWQWNYPTDRNSNNVGVTPGRGEYGRLNNGLFYDSPSMGGFSVHVSAALAPKTATDGGTDSNLGVSLNYDAGPLSLMVSSTKNRFSDKDTFFGAKYTIGDLEIMGAVDKTEVGLGGGGASNTATTVGVSYTVGKARFMAGYGKVDKNQAKHFGIGGMYNLSKRTNVYLSIGNLEYGNAGADSAYGLGINHSF